MINNHIIMNLITQSQGKVYETTIEPQTSDILMSFTYVFYLLIITTLIVLIFIVLLKLIKYLNLKIKYMTRELDN
jgi:hypothetical protein